MGFGERILTLFRLFLLFTVLVAVALISAITTIRLTIHGRQETMPNLVGRPLDAAQRIASGLGLELKVEGRLFTKYPPDQIVSQEPPPETRIKVGHHVHVLVSLGPPKVTIPNVVGSSPRAAQIAAIQGGLTVGDMVEIHSPGRQADQVLAQEPPASAAEVHSPALNLLVSLGELPAYECPNFVGHTLGEARRILREHGFEVGSVQPIPREGVPVETILAQSPAPGSKVDADSVFTFQVAGPPPNPNPPAPATTTPAPATTTPAPPTAPPAPAKTQPDAPPAESRH